MPAVWDTYINSQEYKRTFDDPKRIIYNTIYRLDKIYDNSYKINDALVDAMKHSDDPDNPDDGVHRKHAEYV